MVFSKVVGHVKFSDPIDKSSALFLAYASSGLSRDFAPHLQNMWESCDILRKECAYLHYTYLFMLEVASMNHLCDQISHSLVVPPPTQPLGFYSYCSFSFCHYYLKELTNHI